MIDINLVIEDDLSEEMLRTILKQINREFVVARSFPDLRRSGSSRGFGYIRKRLPGFNNAAKYTPFLVLADLDRNECAPTLIREWLPHNAHPNLIFRVAVKEVESWVLADRFSFSEFLGIPPTLIPLKIDEHEQAPKEFLIQLTRKSKKKEIRQAIVPKKGSTAKVGIDYNGMLSYFLRNYWRLEEAVKYSDSLKRTVNALNRFKPIS